MLIWFDTLSTIKMWRFYRSLCNKKRKSYDNNDYRTKLNIYKMYTYTFCIIWLQIQRNAVYIYKQNIIIFISAYVMQQIMWCLGIWKKKHMNNILTFIYSSRFDVYAAIDYIIWFILLPFAALLNVLNFAKVISYQKNELCIKSLEYNGREIWITFDHTSNLLHQPWPEHVSMLPLDMNVLK